jgi:DNA replicative helicase MCM subunit Mcm2 (Cdc46/Mcm family)
MRLKRTVYWQEKRSCKICQKEFVVDWRQNKRVVCDQECERKNQLKNDSASRFRRLAAMTLQERQELREKKRKYQKQKRGINDTL